ALATTLVLRSFPTRRSSDLQVSGTFMPQKVRIALDAMGGDIGASVVVPGAAISLSRHPDSEFLLFGDRALIEPQLERHPALKARSEEHTSELQSRGHLVCRL